MDGKLNKGISRRSFLATGALAAPVVAGTLTQAAKASPTPAPAIAKGTGKRNVLFISTDDMCNRLACYGDPVMKSPNLDRLGQMGVRFDNHYCQFPLCGPSRTSLMTGLAPDTTKVWGLYEDFRDHIPDAITLSQLFQRNGYFTARAGKIYHYNNPSEIGTPGFDDAASWQKTANPAGYDRVHDEALVEYFAPSTSLYGDHRHTRSTGNSFANSVLRVRQADPTHPGWLHGGTGPSGIRIAQDGRTPILPLSDNGDLGISLAGHPSDGDDAVMTDFMVAESVIAMMTEHKDEPWFLGAGFFRPHVPFIVPSKYYDLYKPEDMPVPPFEPADMKVAPPIAYTSNVPNQGMTTRQHQDCLRGYYAAISFVDAQVGRLLDAMERMDLMKNTTIVFWADHGFMVGEHGQWEKMMLFEASTRVPFFIGGAGVQARGKACHRTSEHLNIYPTLAEMCGLQGVPKNLQGHSLVPLLRDPEAAWDHPSITQVVRAPDTRMGYSLRNERYRYTLWNGGADGEELYDYTNDPREQKNLANEATAKALKAKLRAQLEQITAARGRQHTSTS